MRGKGCQSAAQRGAGGITPACAGKSVLDWRILGYKRDHPRLCGEKGEGGAEDNEG